MGGNPHLPNQTKSTRNYLPEIYKESLKLIMEITNDSNVQDEDLREKYNAAMNTIGLILVLFSITFLPQILAVQEYLIEPCKGSDWEICSDFDRIQFLFVSQFLILLIGGFLVSLSSINRTKMDVRKQNLTYRGVEVEFRCPYCPQLLKLPHNWEGNANCPRCTRDFIVETKARITIDNLESEAPPAARVLNKSKRDSNNN